jgi:hypothetical protein
MFTENVQRSAGVVCSRDAPCCSAKSRDVTDAKAGKVSNLLGGHTVTTMNNGQFFS